MTLKFFSGLGMLLLALFLQIFLISSGIGLNPVLAVLIAFAFIFDFWELFVFVLLSVFILNWQPAPSVALITFALIPLAAYLFCSLTRWNSKFGNLIAIVAGFLIFYLVSAPSLFLQNLIPFFIDVMAGLIIGEFVLFILNS